MNSPAPSEAVTRAILSGALQKANDAVRADKERDSAYAIEAYMASCELLTQVMGRVEDGTNHWHRMRNIVRLDLY